MAFIGKSPVSIADIFLYSKHAQCQEETDAWKMSRESLYG